MLCYKRFWALCHFLATFRFQAFPPTGGRGLQGRGDEINEIGIASQNFFYKCLRGLDPTLGICSQSRLLFVAKYCGALLAAQTHREVRSNPTYQVRVVFGCNHISHFERNANNSASRYRNRCGVPRRQEHRKRSGGDLRGRF